MTLDRPYHIGSALACALLLVTGPGALESQDKRALRLDDLYSEETLSFAKDWSIARDGSLALHVDRAPNTRKAWRVQGADIWVRLAGDDKLTNITNGVSDGTDWRTPLWSPDGQRLLIQSTRGGSRSLWMWDRATRKLRALTDQSFADQPLGSSYSMARVFYEWVDDRRVLAALLPPGVRSIDPGAAEPRPMADAKAGWARFLAGESSVSVLETGTTDTSLEKSGRAAAAPRPIRQLTLIAVTTLTKTVVMDSYEAAARDMVFPSLSPDGRFVMIPIYGAPIRNGGDQYTGTIDIELRRVDGGRITLDHALPKDILRQSPRWSLDGNQLAFFAFGGTRDNAPKLVRVNLVQGRVTERDLGDVSVRHMRDDDWDFARLEWTETGEIVCLAGEGEQAGVKFARRDWWLVPESGPLRKLTGGLPSVPRLERLASAGPLVGIANRTLWKLNADRGTLEPLTDRQSFPVSAIAWPALENQEARFALGRAFIINRESRPPNGMVVVESVDSASGRRSYVRVEVPTGMVTPLPLPAPGALVQRLDPTGGTVYWADARYQGSMVWRTSAVGGDRNSRAVDTVVSLNAWRRDIATPPDTMIQYTSLHGSRYNGWIQLPVGYRPGRRYPTIVRVYPGQQPNPNRDDDYNRLAAAAGYAILWPQMGIVNGRHFNAITKDVYFDLPDGVVPAIDEAVRLGITDPDRLFVEGASGGGFATFGLIEQTHRFKAALGAVGISSWMNGSFSSRGRYGEEVGNLAIGWMDQNIQDRPPVENMWTDLGLYVRNSPIVYAERIKTPLLIVHSDQDDNVPMSQSEEMFSAMVQLKKRASFVRYWGEGHGFENPANLRDLWQRRLAWFEEFGDVTRDQRGAMVFEGDRVKSRGSAQPLAPTAYARFDLFQRGGGR